MPKNPIEYNRLYNAKPTKDEIEQLKWDVEKLLEVLYRTW